MYRASGETLTLTPKQRVRAKRLLKWTREGYVESPTDVVDSWEEPDSNIDWERKDGLFPQQEGFINPSAIAGSVGMSNRLEKHRIKKVLAHMLKGEFEVQNMAPPVLQQRGDSFYVTTDGHHRSMVARAIGLDELYVEYEVVPAEFLV